MSMVQQITSVPVESHTQHDIVSFLRSNRSGPATRIESVDLLRGLVMVIMVLDHVRDFAFAGTLHGHSPTDLNHAGLAVFITRWITHFCAPVFVFLAGTGTYLQELRGAPKPSLARFLLTRGLWLIVLELTVVRFGVAFRFVPIALQVIWMLGCCMIALAALIYLPKPAITVFGLALVIGHNLLDRFGFVPATHGRDQPLAVAASFGQAVWSVLHVQRLIMPFGSAGVQVRVSYPLIPWIGVMALGYVFGQVYSWDAARRRKLLLQLGCALIVGFILARALGGYGDPTPWSQQSSAALTVASFLNVTKYPPSLMFLLMTLGPAIAALAWFERPLNSGLAKAFVALGRVPLFFYLLQWYVAHLLTLGFSVLAGKPTTYLLHLGAGGSPEEGFSLAGTYLIYFTSIALLYPVCRWFGGMKRNRRDLRWLAYF